MPWIAGFWKTWGITGIGAMITGVDVAVGVGEGITVSVDVAVTVTPTATLSVAVAGGAGGAWFDVSWLVVFSLAPVIVPCTLMLIVQPPGGTVPFASERVEVFGGAVSVPPQPLLATLVMMMPVPLKLSVK